MATAVGGFLELVKDGENGFLVPVGDAEALAQALARLIQDRDLLRRIGAANRRVAEEKFDIADTVRNYEELYLRLLEAKIGGDAADERRSSNSPLRCLVLADTFPSALEPWRGPYNRRQIECLARLCRVTAIDPMPWPRLLRDRRAWALAARPDGVLDGMTIHHPVFWYLPVFGRGRTWRGVASAAERALKREPDARWDVILATFAYPHGLAAKRSGGADGRAVPDQGARDRPAFAAGLRRAARADRRGACAARRASSPSAGTLADIALQLGAKPDGVRVLTNGIDARRVPGAGPRGRAAGTRPAEGRQSGPFRRKSAAGERD